jgi:ATP synthase subunit 6
VSILRPLAMLAVLVGACFLTHRHTPHHTASEESLFSTMFMHVIPAPVVGAHGDEAHGTHGEIDHSEGDAAEHAGDHADDHGDDHHHAEPALHIGLPAFLGGFDGHPGKEGHQLVVYNLQIFQFAALMILIGFSGVPTYLRTGQGDTTSKLMAGFCLWVRDDLVEPAMGKELSNRFLPFMMFIFFFIMFMNVMGLTPASVTPTASIFVTGALAFITFSTMIIGGMIAQGPVAFFKNLVPHVPLILWPLMFVIELTGLFLKPAALMIRLFATMTGGHLVVLSFLALIFLFGPFAGNSMAKAVAISPAWVGFSVFVMIIEAFVALVQAYIFTLLSSLFISASIHPEH